MSCWSISLGMALQIQETIAKCLAEASQSESPDAQQKALQSLVSLTRVSSANRNLLCQTDAGISTLLVIAQSSSSNLAQSLALSILINLSLNTNLKPSLARLDIIQHLNCLIISDSSEAGRLASSLICSLAVLDKNKAKFGVAGTVQAIVEALRVGSINSAFHHLLSSLAKLVQFHGNCTIAVRAGVVPVLVYFLDGPDEDLVGSSIAILGLAVRFEEGVEAIRGVEGVVSLVVDLLKKGCMKSRESAVDVLIKLFEESEGYIRAAAEKVEFLSLVADLSVRGSTKARKKADVLMRKIMEANLDCLMEGNSTIVSNDPVKKAIVISF